MWMRHHWQFKDHFNQSLGAGAAKQALAVFGHRVLAEGEGWVLGEIDGGLVLAQAMPIGDGNQIHVMVVAATENEASLVACDQVAQHIEGAQTL